MSRRHSDSDEDSYELYLQWNALRMRDARVRPPSSLTPPVKPVPSVTTTTTPTPATKPSPPPQISVAKPVAAAVVTKPPETVAAVAVAAAAPAPAPAPASVPAAHEEVSEDSYEARRRSAANKGKEEKPRPAETDGAGAYGSCATDAAEEARLAAAAFDSKAWTTAFRHALRENDAARLAFLRRVVQRGTNDVLRTKQYEREGKTVKLADPSASVKRTLFYDGKSAFGSFTRSHQTTAHFVKADVVDVAVFLQEKKNVNPVVLVMADEKRPGGYHEEGTCAMEESIYRRTTLKLNLEDPDQMDREREWKYEIPPYGGIYAPDVQVFRSSEGRGYEFLATPKTVSFICASSIVRPVLVDRKGGQLSEEDVKVTKKKIETILSIGLQNGHDAVVLSAFGCGFNQNPPRHIAQLFREVITQSFSACYRHVTFAIIDDENARQATNPEGNIKPFQDTFLDTSSRASSTKCTLM